VAAFDKDRGIWNFHFVIVRKSKNVLKTKGTHRSDWKITGKSKSSDPTDIAAEALTLGFVKRPNEYEITSEKTGEVKHVMAHSEKGVGKAITRGNLRD